MAVKHPPIEIGDVIGRIRVLHSAGYIRGHRTGWACVCMVCGQELQLEGYQIREMGPRPCKHNPYAKPRKKRAAVAPKTRPAPAIRPEQEERDSPVTSRALALYRAAPAPVRQLTDAMVQHRVGIMRKYKLSIDYDRLLIEAIEIAKIETQNPSPIVEQDKHEPHRAYLQYQSPKGA